MKRELAYLLDAHTPVSGSLGRTRSSKVRCGEINIDSNGFRKRRLKTHHLGKSNLIDNSSLKELGNVERNGVSLNVEENVSSQVNSTVDEDTINGKFIPLHEQNGDLKNPVYQKELTNEFIQHPVMEEVSVESGIVIHSVCTVDDIVDDLINGKSTPMHEHMDGLKKPGYQEEPASKFIQHSTVEKVFGECAIVVDNDCDVERPCLQYSQSSLKPNAEPMEDDSTTEKSMKPVKEMGNELPITGPVIQFSHRTALELRGLTAVAAPLPEISARRITRSALKPLAEPVVEAVSQSKMPMRNCAGSELISKARVDEDNLIMADIALRTLKKNLELKMSKKITLNDRTFTLPDLLETGLLEGMVVTYKMKGNELNGVIKDGGILCSCRSCKGCLVVTPTGFERHACHKKRNAAHYICLENGTSLREVIKLCRETSTDNLEASILKDIGSLSAIEQSLCQDSLPVKVPLICQNCKATFIGPHSSEKIQLCNLCINTETPQTRPSIEPSIRHNSLLAEDTLICPNCKGSSTAICFSEKNQLCNLCIKSKVPQAMPAREPSDSVPAREPLICQNCKGTFVAPCSSEKVKLCDLCIISETPLTRITCKNGNGDRSPKLNLTSISPETPVLSISSENESEWKITKKQESLPAEDALIYSNCKGSSTATCSSENNQLCNLYINSKAPRDMPVREHSDSLPAKEPLICQNCKGYLIAHYSSENSKLCNLCINSETPLSRITHQNGKRARSPELDLTSNSPETPVLSISSKNRSELKITRMQESLPPEDLLNCRNCKGSSTVTCSSEKNQMCNLCINSKSPQTMPDREPSDSMPAREHLICQNCKGSFIAPCSSVKSKLCNLCIDSETPVIRITRKNDTRARSPDLDLTSNSPEPSLLSVSLKSRSEWKITRKNFRLHSVVFGKGGLPDGTELAYYTLGQKILEGYKMGSGIFCFCCNSEVSASIFEAHAGFKSRRKPYHHIYTSNGVSLHELAVSLSKGRKSREHESDDLCIICHDGGDLLLCDGCPRAFHKECASLSSTPTSEWYCKYCHNMFERESSVAHNANAVAAGRVSGVDPIEQITKRCIRIIKNPDTSVLGGCVLCRCHDFHKSGFGPRTVIICDQCEREFHVGCLKDHEMADLKELPKGKWFCGTDCTRIYSILKRLLDCGAGKLPDSFICAIRKKVGEECSDSDKLDVRWRLLSGKLASTETKFLLSKAVAIFHDCFDPIVDPRTGRDLIPCMVYGRQEFAGMYCSILTVNSNVVSTGIIRIFGSDVAELPLAATCKGSHGKGYFQTLFSCVERLLGFLNVKSLVLPAAEEAGSIWTDKFAFQKIPPDQLCTYKKSCSQISSFKGTCMLQKIVSKFGAAKENAG